MKQVDENEAARIAWVSTQLKALPEGMNLLDAGAGEQQYRKYCGHLKYTSQDFAAYDPKKLNEGLQMDAWNYGQLDIVSDITAIPRPDASFDAVLCTEVLEHVPDAVAALKELTRLIKPGGKLILTAPFSSMTHFAPYHFSTGFNRFYYEHHLSAMGMEIEEMSPNGNYFSFLTQELSRAPHVATEYGLNPLSRAEAWILNKARLILERYKMKGGASSELLCLGWHIRAVKK